MRRFFSAPLDSARARNPPTETRSAKRRRGHPVVRPLRANLSGHPACSCVRQRRHPAQRRPRPTRAATRGTPCMVRFAGFVGGEVTPFQGPVADGPPGPHPTESQDRFRCAVSAAIDGSSARGPQAWAAAYRVFLRFSRFSRFSLLGPIVVMRGTAASDTHLRLGGGLLRLPAGSTPFFAVPRE